MKKYFPLTSPVPFKDQYEIASFTQEHALGDVVKSAAPPRLGFHVDLHAVKGDEPDGGQGHSLHDHVDRSPGDHDHVVEENHDDFSSTANGEHDDDFRSQRGEPPVDLDE